MRPRRLQHRRHGKSDEAGARAARAVLAGDAPGTARSQPGPVDAIRLVRVVRRHLPTFWTSVDPDYLCHFWSRSSSLASRCATSIGTSKRPPPKRGPLAPRLAEDGSGDHGSIVIVQVSVTAGAVASRLLNGSTRLPCSSVVYSTPLQTTTVLVPPSICEVTLISTLVSGSLSKSTCSAAPPYRPSQ